VHHKHHNSNSKLLFVDTQYSTCHRRPYRPTFSYFCQMYHKYLGLEILQNTENKANLLLPLGIQRLKGFQLQRAKPPDDGWLSWPCWLTDSGRFTHKVVTRRNSGVTSIATPPGQIIQSRQSFVYFRKLLITTDWS